MNGEAFRHYGSCHTPEARRIAPTTMAPQESLRLSLVCSILTGGMILKESPNQKRSPISDAKPANRSDPNMQAPKSKTIMGGKTAMSKNHGTTNESYHQSKEKL